MTLDKRILFLEEQVRYLSSEKLEAMTAMELAASLGNFGTSLNKLRDPIPIFHETILKIRSLFKLKTLCFYLVDEKDSNFKPAYCEPQEDFFFIAEEVEHMIEESTFAWCLGRNKPHITIATAREETLIIHTLATHSRIRGVFVGVLGQERFSISDSSMNLFTIIIHACAQMLESYELYAWNRRTLEEMQQKLQQQQTKEKKLCQQHQALVQQFEENQQALAQTSEKLNKEMEKRKEAENASRKLAKLERVLTKLAQQMFGNPSPDGNALFAAQAAASLTGSSHSFACWFDPDSRSICFPSLDRATIRHFSLQKNAVLQADRLPGPWGIALLSGKPFYSNEPVSIFPLQQGVKKTIGPKRILSVPVLDRSAPIPALLGHITLSNAPKPYDPSDAMAIERIATLYAFSLKHTLYRFSS